MTRTSYYSHTVVDLAAYRRAKKRRELLYTIFALWTERLGFACLLAYLPLRLLLVPGVKLGLYVGPLSLLAAAAYFLAAVSFVTDTFFLPPED